MFWLGKNNYTFPLTLVFNCGKVGNMKAETKTKQPLLSEQQKKEIRKRYANRLATRFDTMDALANDFEVSTRTIWLVIQGK